MLVGWWSSAIGCRLTAAPMTQKANPVTLTSYGQAPVRREGSGAFRRGRDRDWDLGGAFQYSRRGLRLRRRGAYGIHRACRPLVPRVVFAPLRGAADWRSGPRWSIISVLCPVHPFPLRGTSPQGETRK